MADQQPYLSGHDHPLPVIEEPLDPANQSLSDALRASFRVLKLVMAVVVVLYLVSGVFMVDQKEVVVLLRFGKQVGPPRQPGLHFALPYPIDEKIRVPTAPKTLMVDTFWLQIQDADKGKDLDQLMARGNSLDPAVDGALVTGDKAIMHLLYKVQYRITDANQFVRSVSDEDKLLRAVLENAAVSQAGRTTADVLWKKPDRMVAAIHARAQAQLDRLGSGLAIENVAADRSHYPLQVKEEFLGVSNAENRMRELIQEANKEWEEKLKGAAGPAWEPLFREIQKLASYDDENDAKLSSYDDENDPQCKAALDEIERLLVEDAKGEAGKRIQLAKGRRDKIVFDTLGQVSTFEALLEEYRRSPELVRQRFLQNMLNELFSRPDVVKWLLPPGRKVLYLNKDQKEVRDAARALSEQRLKRSKPK